MVLAWIWLERVLATKERENRFINGKRAAARPLFSTGALRTPVLRPSQLRYAITSSSASTAATESSKSRIVVRGTYKDVLNPRPVGCADAAAAVDHKLDVQAVVAQQHAGRRAPGSPAYPANAAGSASGTGPVAVSAAKPA